MGISGRRYSAPPPRHPPIPFTVFDTRGLGCVALCCSCEWDRTIHVGRDQLESPNFRDAFPRSSAWAALSFTICPGGLCKARSHHLVKGSPVRCCFRFSSLTGLTIGNTPVRESLPTCDFLWGQQGVTKNVMMPRATPPAHLSQAAPKQRVLPVL